MDLDANDDSVVSGGILLVADDGDDNNPKVNYRRVLSHKRNDIMASNVRDEEFQTKSSTNNNKYHKNDRNKSPLVGTVHIEGKKSFGTTSSTIETSTGPMPTSRKDETGIQRSIQSKPEIVLDISRSDERQSDSGNFPEVLEIDGHKNSSSSLRSKHMQHDGRATLKKSNKIKEENKKNSRVERNTRVFRNYFVPSRQATIQNNDVNRQATMQNNDVSTFPQNDPQNQTKTDENNNQNREEERREETNFQLTNNRILGYDVVATAVTVQDDDQQQHGPDVETADVFLQEDNNSRNPSMAIDPSSDYIIEATKDSFCTHVKHNRKTQVGFCLVCLGFVVLVITLGVVLLGKTNDSTNPETNKKDEWKQVGATIGGLDHYQLGTSVSISADGRRIAVAAPGAQNDISIDDGGTRYFGRGLVQIYESTDNDNKKDKEQEGKDVTTEINEGEDETTSIDWNLIGEIRGSAIDYASSSSSSLISSGLRLVRGGYVVAMSRDGNGVAVGSSFHDEGLEKQNIGLVEVYEYVPTENDFNDDKNWIPFGNPIVGEHANDYFGASLAFADSNKNGRVLAIGAPGYDGINGNKPECGKVSTYFYNGSDWNLINTIEGRKSQDWFGLSVDLSEDGSVVSIGSRSAPESNDPVVWVYEYKISEAGFGLKGEKSGLLGKAGLNETGWMASLSADGNTVAIANYYTDSSGGVSSDESNNLVVRVFQFNEDGGYWEQLGSNVHENLVGEKSGYVVTLSDDGLVMVMGDPGNGGGGASSTGATGHAHMYRYGKVNNDDEKKDWIQVREDINGFLFGDQFGYSVAMSGDATRFVVGGPLSRNSAQDFLAGRVKVYDISDIWTANPLSVID